MREEPVGVGVTSYHKPLCIRQILNALKADKFELIRIFLLGKLVEKAEKPSFSRQFGRFIIFRQLKFLKKHKVWFLFASKPVRFSLREFAIVTGFF